MTKTLEIHDLAETGQVQLYLKDGSDSQPASPVGFPLPLEAGAWREIQWYFRDYLDNPFGPAQERAQGVETALRNLGRLLFEVVFGSPEARGWYAAAAEGLEDYQLVIVSRRTEFLALPWELLNEPDAGYLASRLASVVRRTSPEPRPQFNTSLPTDQLNVLLVSPGANSESPTPFRSMAVEAVKVLESLPVPVELEYLSTPTFPALADALAHKPGYYHLVHLDGLAIDPAAGCILFQDADSADDPVPASRVAGLLSEAGVPVALLTAGDGRRQPDPNAWSEATACLVEGGVPLAVVLPYPLHDAATREKLLQPFYLALSQGGDVAGWVSRSRRALMDAPQRSTLRGPHIFWDWIIPQVYQSQEYTAPAIEVEQPNPLAPPVVQPQQPESQVPEPQLPAPGQFGLVGRQWELRRLERLLRQHPVVLLAGNTGVGKTELALGLARWAQHAARRQWPGGVFYTTFETSHPSGLERVVHEIGTAIAGLDFADLPAPQQRQWALDYLQSNASLIIWDNLENVAGFPSGAPGLLEPQEQAGLADFLAEATRRGSTRALLVDRRRQEPWLNTQHGVEELYGLRGHDRLELAALVLEKAGVGPARLGPEIVDLLDLVQGHPLAMQIALPLLKDVPAAALVAELTRTVGDLPAGATEEGRDPCLTAVMEYAWSKMSHRSRTHLPFLALFQRRVMMDILNHMTQEQAYRNVMGEQLGWGACRTLLRSAQASGFLDPVSPSVYQIHPALPWFLGRKLSQQVRGPGIGQLEQEFVRVYADTADYFMESLYENQDSGVTAVLAEEGNLTQALGLALEAGQWDNAQLLVQPLAQVYRMQKRFPELRRLRRQLLEAVGPSAEEASAHNGIELWLYLLGTEASESIDTGDLEHAESLNRQLLDYLSAQPQGESDPRTAAVHHQMGLVALKRWQLDEAAGWFQKSLAIIEDSDDRAAVADNYYALGQVKQYQRYYTEAKEWYQKALDIHQRLPDDEEMIKDYRALGLVCQLKFEYQEAENWYHRARDLAEEQRDEETAVLIYHELGTVCHAQYLFDSASSWYQQALNLSDRLGKADQIAIELHHLGLLTQARGIVYEEAEEWYLAALEQWEKLGNRKAIGDECRQLGVLFHEQKRFEDARKWYHQAREVFEEMGDPQRMARTYGQLGMIAEEEGDLNEALEWVARTYQMVEDYDLPVMVQVKAHLARLRDKCGPESFAQRWRDYTGQEAPTDLEVDTSGIL